MLKKLVHLPWKKFKSNIKRNSFRLDLTLKSGQVFGWKQLDSEGNRFLGMIKLKPFEITYDEDGYVIYRSFSPAVEHAATLDERQKMLSVVNNNNDDVEMDLVNYFNLDMDLERVLSDFCQRDQHFSQILLNSHCSGLRLITYDAFECLISFICSSNNNVDRICKMVTSLTEKYGQPIGNHEGGTSLYAFPTCDQLLGMTEDDLKTLNFGYRAKYLVKTVEFLKDSKNCEKYLHSLKDKSFDEVILQLRKDFFGVGLKVASCVALYSSLKKLNVVPLDVHMLRIARMYIKQDTTGVTIGSGGNGQKVFEILKKKSLGDDDTFTVMKYFESLFGELAGVAQLYLFASQVNSIQKQQRKRKALN